MKLSRWFPTDAWVRLAIVPALAFIATAIDHQYLVDFWHHLARGRAIVTEGRLLDHDVFTYTVAGSAFRDANWLSQVCYYLLFQRGGLELVQFVNSAVVALTFFLITLFCWRRSGSLPAAMVAGNFVFFGSWQVLTLRPQTFSMLLFVLVYLALDGAERRRWLLFVPPLLIGLWANLHGAFPAGIMLVGCYLLAAAWRAWRNGSIRSISTSAPRPQRSGLSGGRISSPLSPTGGEGLGVRGEEPACPSPPSPLPFSPRGERGREVWLLTACLLASVLATLANPYGWGIYQYVGVTSQRAVERGIIEWLPPSFDLHISWAGLASVVILACLYVTIWRRGISPRARDLCLIVCFLPLACCSVRMIVWWLIVAAPLACSLWASNWSDAKLPRLAARPSWSAALVFSLVLLATLVSVPGLQAHNPLLHLPGRDTSRTERDLDEACRYLHAHHPTGRIFTRFEWGEYIGWAAAPDFTVFMDGRIEIYPDAIWNNYATVTQGHAGWQEMLDEYHVDFLILDSDYHAKAGLLAQVANSSHWHRVFQSGDVIVFARQSGS